MKTMVDPVRMLCWGVKLLHRDHDHPTNSPKRTSLPHLCADLIKPLTLQHTSQPSDETRT